MSIPSCSTGWWRKKQPHTNTDRRPTTDDDRRTVFGAARASFLAVLYRLSSAVRPPAGAALAWRLALFYCAVFAALGVQLPFLPVWLVAKGLDPSAIGIVLAIPMVVRLIAIPMVTQRADRHDAVRAAIITASIGGALAYCALGLAEGVAAVIAIYTLAAAFSSPLMPLADAYAIRGLGRDMRAYGPVRLWGSAAFITASLGAGLLLDVVGAVDLIWLAAAGMILTMAAALGLAPIATDPASGPAKQSSREELLRQPAFLAVAAAASLIQASHAVYYGFSTIDWQAAGLPGGTIGALWALAVLAEIVFFAVSARLAISPTALLLMGACGAVVRWSAMAFDPPMALLPPLQCLHALSFGATHLGAVVFVAHTAPTGSSATAQGYLAIALGLIMAMAMGISGALYAHWGSLAYLAMAIMAAAGGLSAFAAFRFTSHLRQDSVLTSVAGLVHRGKLAATEIHHPRRQAATTCNPAANILRIDFHQQAGCGAARHRLAIVAGMPSCMKSKACARRDADAFGGDHTQHHRACGEAGPIDDHPLTRAAQRHQVLEIWPDLAPCIGSNSHSRLCSRNRQRHYHGAGQNCSQPHTFPSVLPASPCEGTRRPRPKF